MASSFSALHREMHGPCCLCDCTKSLELQKGIKMSEKEHAAHSVYLCLCICVYMCICVCECARFLELRKGIRSSEKKHAAHFGGHNLLPWENEREKKDECAHVCARRNYFLPGNISGCSFCTSTDAFLYILGCIFI